MSNLPAFESVVGGVGTDLLLTAHRRSIESTSFDLNSPQAWDLLGGRESMSGVKVEPESALQYSPWWRGVNLIARDVGKLPLHVYKRRDGGKDRDVRHPAYRLCRWKPNPYQTANVFRMQLIGHAVARGNGYALIERNKMTGEPLRLWPLDPEGTYPVREEDGTIWYVIESGGGPVTKVKPEDILHIKGLSYDGLIGYNVVDLARDEIGLGIGARKFCEVFLKNGVRPSIVLEAPGTIREDQLIKLRDGFERMYAGINNMYRTMILTQGLTAKPLTIDANTGQVQQTRDMSVKDMSNWLGIPPHKLGNGERSAYNSLEQENLSYLQDCLDFWLSSFEYESQDKLLSEEEKDSESHLIEFNLEKLQRADFKSTTMGIRILTGGRPVVTPDEARSMLNMNTLGGDAGQLLTPANFGQGGTFNDPAIDGDGDTGDGGDDTESIDPADTNRALVIEAVCRAQNDAERRVWKRLAVAAAKAARSPATFVGWLDSVESDHAPAVRDILTPACGVAEAMGLLGSAEDQCRSLIATARTELLEVAGRAQAAGLAAAVRQWATDHGVKLEGSDGR